jgi:hypothetical protein
VALEPGTRGELVAGSRVPVAAFPQKKPLLLLKKTLSYLQKEHHSSFSLKSMPPRRGLSGFCGVTKIRVDRWKSRVNLPAVDDLPGRVVYLGQFDTKEEAAAAHDSVARRHSR